MTSEANLEEWRDAIRQKQFLEVVGRDEAADSFQRHLDVTPKESEAIPIARSAGRILSADVVSNIDVPAFDRSNVDGFALRASDTIGASEDTPVEFAINQEVLSPGMAPQIEIAVGTATPIATGGMLPRGADAVVMIEHTELSAEDDQSQTVPRLKVQRSTSAGQLITSAGADVARGETVLRTGQLLTSREIGVIAALGRVTAEVWKRPRVAIISTGNEIVAPGKPLPLGAVYDSNAAILSAAVEELGCEAVPLGTVRDDIGQLQQIMKSALECDAVILSGGTSKGAGDLSYQVVSQLTDPGIVAHGVALKPGKPICLAVTSGKPVVVLPGFPTSAIFTFHEFVAPVLRQMSGLPPENRHTVEATLPRRVNSDRGRTEYLLVSLIQGDDGLTAWPMGKGSGSVTTFSLADGFVSIDQHTEIVDAGTRVPVTLIGESLTVADLVIIGSHCVGLDFLIGELRKQGLTTKVLNVGSMGGAQAARRGECDIAGVHLLDEVSGQYNVHLTDDSIELLPGYKRRQGIVFRPGDDRFEARSVEVAIAAALADPKCTMVNRNAGSGTRILIEQLLGSYQPPGFSFQTRSHNAVATAVLQRRADWGVAIDTVARDYELGFLPMRDEHYDFLIPKSRNDRNPVKAFRSLLQNTQVRNHLQSLGFAAK